MNDKLEKFINSPAYLEKVASVLPRSKELTPELFRGILLNCVRRVPKLQQCDPPSFFAAALRMAEMGLRADGRQAYLIPYENRKKGIVECQLIVSYLGLQDLLMATGKVARIHADNVYANDIFEHDLGKVTRHTYKLGSDRGEYIGSYCCIFWLNGEQSSAILSADEIEQIRKSSRAANDGPWVTFTGEMRKKTAIRRAMKHAPLGRADAVLAELDEEEFGNRTTAPKSFTSAGPQPITVTATLESTSATSDNDNLDYGPPPPIASLPVSQDVSAPPKRGPGRPPKVNALSPDEIPIEQLPGKIRSALTLAGLGEAELLDYLRTRGLEDSLSSLEEMQEAAPLALRTLFTELDNQIKAALAWSHSA